MRALLPILAFTASGVLGAGPQAPLLQHQRLNQPTAHNLPSTSSEALLHLHRKLIETESITENENDVGQWLSSYLEANNLIVEKQEVSPKRYNILAYPKTRETKVLVTSHIDTVRFGFFLIHLFLATSFIPCSIPLTCFD
jgi:acetylornithine deacetylase